MMASVQACVLAAAEPAPGGCRLVLDGPWVWTLWDDGSVGVEVAPLTLAYLAGRLLTPDETDADLAVAYDLAMRRISVVEGWTRSGDAAC